MADIQSIAVDEVREWGSRPVVASLCRSRQGYQGSRSYILPLPSVVLRSHPWGYSCSLIPLRVSLFLPARRDSMLFSTEGPTSLIAVET